MTAVLTDHCWLRYQPIKVQYCFEGIYCHVTSFQLIAGAVFSQEGSCVYELHYKKFELKLTSAWFGWFQTDLGCKNSASFHRQRRWLTYHGHALVTLYIQFLCSNRSKFDWWVLTQNLCNICNLVPISPILLETWFPQSLFLLHLLLDILSPHIRNTVAKFITDELSSTFFQTMQPLNRSPKTSSLSRGLQYKQGHIF